MNADTRMLLFASGRQLDPNYATIRRADLAEEFVSLFTGSFAGDEQGRAVPVAIFKLSQYVGCAERFALTVFFIADQNRRLLLNEDGSMTQRGQDVIAHTPAARFGDPDDLLGAVIFLAADGAGFVSGITLPVDGAYLCHNI